MWNVLFLPQELKLLSIAKRLILLFRNALLLEEGNWSVALAVEVVLGKLLV